MKSKLLLSTLFLFCAITANFAQTSVSQAGIAIQGIARGENNTAIVSQPINLKFTFYYLDASSIQKVIYSVTKNLTTDAFGVFSDVVDPTAVNNALFANKVVSLKIEKGDELISDEPLRHVPYAISANNGVPTGSIMPFIGIIAPQGWVLCDGKPLPNTATDLIAMLGNSNAPNLLGMFLRGTGTAGSGQTGPALKTVQQDDLKSHLHYVNLTTTTNGDHTHTNDPFTGLSRYAKSGEKTTASGIDETTGEVDVKNLGSLLRSGNHNHNVTGNTGNTGITESRPVNYGVNYIIKL